MGASHAYCPTRGRRRRPHPRAVRVPRRRAGRALRLGRRRCRRTRSRVLACQRAARRSTSGEPGTFDEHGVTPLSVVRLPTGGCASTTRAGSAGCGVRYTLFTGAAESDDDGRTFERVSQVPVLDRADGELHMRTGGHVRRSGTGGGCGTRAVPSGSAGRTTRAALRAPPPRSPDGLAWPRSGEVCLDAAAGRARLRAALRDRARRTAADVVLAPRTSTRGYELGYAESRGRPRAGDATTSAPGSSAAPRASWDAEMVGLSSSAGDPRRHVLLFYNGNGYGATGFRRRRRRGSVTPPSSATSLDARAEWDAPVAPRAGAPLPVRARLHGLPRRPLRGRVAVRALDGRPVACCRRSRHGDEVVSHGGLTFGGLLSGPDADGGARGRGARAPSRPRCARTASRRLRLQAGAAPLPPRARRGGPVRAARRGRAAGAARRQRGGAAGPRPAVLEERRRARAARPAAGLELGESDRIEEFMALVGGGARANATASSRCTRAAEMRLLADRFPGRIRLFAAPRTARRSSLACSSTRRRWSRTRSTSPRAARARAARAATRSSTTCCGVYADKWFDFGISNERGGSAERRADAQQGGLRRASGRRTTATCSSSPDGRGHVS